MYDKEESMIRFDRCNGLKATGGFSIAVST